jgi:CRISPR-associated protein Csd1
MLQVLREYGEKLGGEPGFKTREVRWYIDVSADGRLLGLLPLGDGKSGKMIARCPDMHGMNAGGRAHFLVESAQTVARHFKANEDPEKVESTLDRHRFYVNLIVAASQSTPSLASISSLLSSETALVALRDHMVVAKVKPTDWIGWRVHGQDPVSAPDVQSWWRNWRLADQGAGNGGAAGSTVNMVCMLSGQLVEPLPTHPKVTGLAGLGGLAMGDVMVGCDKSAFTSFNLEQSANAAIGAVAAQQYADGLNDLIRNHAKRIGSSLCVYWFKHAVAPKDDPFALLYGLESKEQQVAAASLQARALLDAIRSGQRTDLGLNVFHAMTLSGASGRVMVRDWMDGRFEQLVAHIDTWFTDLSIVECDGKALTTDPRFLAVAGGLVREDLKELPAPVMGNLWHAAVANVLIPKPLMAQALHRFRLSVVVEDTTQYARSRLHARISLIKAYFIRKTQGGDKHMKPYLNPDHPDPAYHCGRLLAVLAKLQHAALGDVGAGVVQRFYPAASQTPGLTLGRLVANARNHLGKLDGGLAWWFEERIAEIMGRLHDQIPRTLNLEEQGLFALGYYQQLAELRGGKKSNGNNNGKEATE